MLYKNVLLLDMNTTGNNPDVDSILEISFIPLEVNEVKAIEHDKINFYPLNNKDKALKTIDDDLRTIYHKNNLIIDLFIPDNKKNTFHFNNPKCPLYKVINDIFKCQEFYLCGFNIDLHRRFLNKYIPSLSKYISNNTIDLYSFIFIKNIHTRNNDNLSYINHRTSERIDYIFEVYKDINVSIIMLNKVIK